MESRSGPNSRRLLEVLCNPTSKQGPGKPTQLATKATLNRSEEKELGQSGILMHASWEWAFYFPLSEGFSWPCQRFFFCFLCFFSNDRPETGSPKQLVFGEASTGTHLNPPGDTKASVAENRLTVELNGERQFKSQQLIDIGSTPSVHVKDKMQSFYFNVWCLSEQQSSCKRKKNAF